MLATAHTHRSHKISRVTTACSNCAKAHAACDHARPCGRCVRKNLEGSCYNVAQKKRGRKNRSLEDVRLFLALAGASPGLSPPSTSSTSPPLSSSSSPPSSTSPASPPPAPALPLAPIELSPLNRLWAGSGCIVSDTLPAISHLSPSLAARWGYPSFLKDHLGPAPPGQLSSWLDLFHPGVRAGWAGDLVWLLSPAAAHTLAPYLRRPPARPASLQPVGRMPGSFSQAYVVGRTLVCKARSVGESAQGEVFEFAKECHIVYSDTEPHVVVRVVSYFYW